MIMFPGPVNAICGHCGQQISRDQPSRLCDVCDAVYHKTCLPASLNMDPNSDDLVLTHGNGSTHMRWTPDRDIKIGESPVEIWPAEIGIDILGYNSVIGI
ncbi:unnamed protein product [Rotaria socialis]|uniref:Uncharacterized protein n=2 Tax=Rotaria socialis TaxID=392032 RepID=A0A821T961_9BILA|nr:unnamed protein product [Rotaria socialis]